MSDDFRVPVARIEAELWLVDGSDRTVTLFCPPDQLLGDLLESDRPFLPALENDRVLLVARSAVVVLWSEAKDLPPIEEGLPVVERPVQLQLAGSRHLEGILRFVPSEAGNRTVDILNEPGRCLPLLVGQRSAHVAKNHVLFLREA